MSTRKSLLLVALLSFAASAFCNVYEVSTVPDPKVTCADCWVSNPDGIVSTDCVDQINFVAQYLKNNVNVEMAYVVIDAFDEDKYADAFDFAQTLFNTWHIGSAENNAGVLVLFALQSRDIRIHTGGGLEGLLPDMECDMILEDNIGYLSEGDYDKGLYGIATDIASHLVTDEAQAELLLGYKPESTEPIKSRTRYMIIAILAFVLLYVLAYRKWNANEDKSRAKLLEDTSATQTAMGCLSFLFPFPVLFLYLYFRIKRSNLRNVPYPCPKCRTDMKKLSDIDELVYLSPAEQTEQKLESQIYDVWLCPKCGEVHREIYPGKKMKHYSTCHTCGARALEFINVRTIKQATYTSEGEKELTFKCHHCGKEEVTHRIIPMLVHSSSSSSGGGYGRSSGRSSGGSWGGGSSFGGGAGRKF